MNDFGKFMQIGVHEVHITLSLNEIHETLSNTLNRKHYAKRINIKEKDTL